MIDALSHRGPDDHGIYEGPGVTLGHRRLSIIDLGGGHQPIVDRSQGLSIVFNGEIYNYKALSKELSDEGIKLDTDSDTEVILRLYQSRGTRVLQSLRGQFAFAIWDEAKQQLFAARDHLGQKPFYYHPDNSKFAFSSEIKDLAVIPQNLYIEPPQVDHLDRILQLRIHPARDVSAP